MGRKMCYRKKMIKHIKGKQLKLLGEDNKQSRLGPHFAARSNILDCGEFKVSHSFEL